MGVTIKDIALLAQVSHTTVSRALNDSPLISEETKSRICKLAAEHGYVPNLSARSLVLVRSFNIGLFFSSLVSTTTADFMHTIVKSVDQNMDRRYHMNILAADSYPIDNFSQRNFDGIIFISQFQEDDKVLQKIIDADIPLAVLNRPVSFSGVINLYCDEKQGIRKAVDYLVDSGHRKIGFIAGKKGSSSSQLRYEGFIESLKARKIHLEDKWLLSGDFSPESGYQAGLDLLNCSSLPTALISSSDSMAIGMIRALQENQIEVPREISVVGFDNGPLTNYSWPSLTSVSRPISEMCGVGTKLLMERLQGENLSKASSPLNIDTYTEVFLPDLHIKESVFTLK